MKLLSTMALAVALALTLAHRHNSGCCAKDRH